MRAEGIVISGGIVRARQKYDYFKRLRMNTKPSHGPFHYAAPARMPGAAARPLAARWTLLHTQRVQHTRRSRKATLA